MNTCVFMPGMYLWIQSAAAAAALCVAMLLLMQLQLLAAALRQRVCGMATVVDVDH